MRRGFSSLFLGELGVFDDRTSQAVSYWSGSLGIDPNLITAVIMTESGGNPNAIGSAGEIGLMQVMPATGAIYGVSRDQLFDPYYNVMAGATYLKDLTSKYGLQGGIQAYNLGETKYRKGSTSPTYLAKVMSNLSSTQSASVMVSSVIPSSVPEEYTPPEVIVDNYYPDYSYYPYSEPAQAGFVNVAWLLIAGLGIGIFIELIRRRT